MKRSALIAAVLAITSCRDFGELVARCRDGGPCAAGGGTGGAGGSTGGGAGGSGGGVVAVSDAGPLCPDGFEASTLGAGDASSFCFNGFAWENPKPQGNALTSAYVAAPNDIWVGGAASMLMRWDGTRWTSWQNAAPTQRASTQPQELGTVRAIAGLDSANVWLGGDDIPPTYFDGGTWQPQSLNNDERVEALAVARLNGVPVVRAVGPGPTVERSPDFAPSTLSAESPNVTGVAIAGDGRCRILGNNGAMWAVYDCEDGGRVVPQTALPAVIQPWTTPMFAEDAGTFVFGIGNQLRRLGVNDVVTPSAGTTNAQLTVVTRTGPATLLAIDYLGRLYQGDFDASPLQTATLAPPAGQDTKEVFYLGAGGSPGNSVITAVGGLFAKQTGPTTFTRQSRGPNFDFYGIDVTATGWTATGENTLVLTSSGTTGGGAANDALDVWRAPGGRLFAVTSDGNLLAITNTTATVVQPIGDGGMVRGLFGFSENDVIAVGDDGIFEGKPDAGFRRVPGVNDALFHVHGAGNTAWAVGVNSAMAIRGADGGWTRQPQPAQVTTLFSVWLSGPNDGWIVGGDLTLFKIEAGQPTFVALPTTQFRPYNLYDVWGFGADDVWAVGERGLVIHYNGTTWTPVESGTHNRLEAVRGRLLSNGRRELFLVGEYGTILRKIY